MNYEIDFDLIIFSPRFFKFFFTFQWSASNICNAPICIIFGLVKFYWYIQLLSALNIKIPFEISQNANFGKRFELGTLKFSHSKLPKIFIFGIYDVQFWAVLWKQYLVKIRPSKLWIASRVPNFSLCQPQKMI